MIQLGKFSTLKAYRYKDQGWYLEDDQEDEVLLPNKYVPNGFEMGEEIEVFVYTDSEDRLIATTERPKIVVGEFAYLEVVQVTKFGAFLDWGLDKNLLVPFSQQKRNMEEGEWHVVYLYCDEITDRLVASAKWHKFVDSKEISVKDGEEVDLLVAHPTDLGWNVIINNRHAGLIYNNEIFQPIYTGDRVKGYVKQVRPDNKIDVSLEQQGFSRIEPNAQKILEILKKEKGFLNLTDKSDPELIKRRLSMSKKTFKKAIGTLYKQRLIRLEKDGTYLVG